MKKIQKRVTSDNDLTDWVFSAQRGQACSYYEYDINSSKQPMLCDMRTRKHSPNTIRDMADKAWSLYQAGYVHLVQQRMDGVCHYLAVRSNCP